MLLRMIHSCAILPNLFVGGQETNESKASQTTPEKSHGEGFHTQLNIDCNLNLIFGKSLFKN